jgi:ubiquinone biosynthesis protein COQ9
MTGIEHLRDLLVKAMLFHAGMDGWTEKALFRAADDLGVPHREALRAFPGTKAKDMIFHMHTLGDRKLQHDLAQQEAPPLRVRDKVILGVRLRLEPWSNIGADIESGDEAASGVDARQALKRAAPILLAPHNAAMSAEMIFQTVNIIWKYAGDVSVDINFYSKRGLLASAYISTLLYWLNDPSPGQQESWVFLEKRIDQAMNIGRKSGQATQKMAEKGGAAFAAAFKAPLPNVPLPKIDLSKIPLSKIQCPLPNIGADLGLANLLPPSLRKMKNLLSRFSPIA